MRKEVTPETAESLCAEQYPFVPVMWNGVAKVMRLKRLNSIELTACGDFSVFASVGKPAANNKKKKHEKILREFIEIRLIQDKVARACMVSPSYDEIIEEVDRVNPGRKEKLGELEDLRKQAEEFSNPNDPEVKKLILEMDCIAAQHSFPLPEDAYSFLMAWANGSDKIQLEHMRKEVMVRHAALAEKSRKTPSEICGLDPENKFLCEDYDANCFLFLQETRELLRVAKGK